VSTGGSVVSEKVKIKDVKDIFNAIDSTKNMRVRRLQNKA
jgi:hypothetical protein